MPGKCDETTLWSAEATNRRGGTRVATFATGTNADWANTFPKSSILVNIRLPGIYVKSISNRETGFQVWG
jgi:hypothetical protein